MVSRFHATIKTGVSALLFVLLILSSGLSQSKSFDEKAFFDNLKTSYYTLGSQGIKNFVALVTSSKMETFAQENWENKEIFPLQLIWFNPSKLYISQRGVPKIKEGKYKEYQDLVNALKTQLKGILTDLERFYFDGIYNSIQGDYVLKHNEKEVQITQTQNASNVITKIKYLFGYNGLCLYNEIVYPQENKTISIYPRFKIVKNKWLCQGWTVQTFVGDEVESGFNITIDNGFTNQVWVPLSILIEVQKAELKGKTFYDEIKLRNYLFNQSIQFVPGPKRIR